MTEIEYVAGSAPKGLERFLNLATDDFRRGQQHCGIEIALERGTGTDPPARISEVDAPVQTDAIASGRGDPLEPRRAALGEDDDRDPRRARAALELGQHPLDVFERELPVRRRRKAPAPGVEDHYHVHTRLDLRVQQGRYGPGIGLKNAMEKLGSLVQHELHVAP